jgi:hypothetical protein
MLLFSLRSTEGERDPPPDLINNGPTRPYITCSEFCLDYIAKETNVKCLVFHSNNFSPNLIRTTACSIILRPI